MVGIRPGVSICDDCDEKTKSVTNGSRLLFEAVVKYKTNGKDLTMPFDRAESDFAGRIYREEGSV